MIAALTGGMGSGKSTALKFFEEAGLTVIDADTICHSLYDDRHPEIIFRLRERWGDGVITADGTVNRREVAGIVFKNGAELEWLNSLLHPIILKNGFELYKSGRKNALFAVPLLYESGWDIHFETVLAVWTEDSLRTARLLARGMNMDEIRSRDSEQMNPAAKLERADFGLINNGSVELLKEQCLDIININFN